MGGRGCPKGCKCKRHGKWGPRREYNERLVLAAHGVLALAKEIGLENNARVRELREVLDGTNVVSK